MARMTTYLVDGQQIHVREEGRPDGPTLLMIHGWMSSWYCWVPLLPILGTRYRCIAVDLPGFGDSPALPQAPTISRYAELMAKLIVQLSEEPVTIMGHSMGGLIGATVALRNAALVERLILICPALSGRLSWFMNTVVAPQVLIQNFPPLEWLLVRATRVPAMTRYLQTLIRTPSLAERSQLAPSVLERISADLRRPGGGRTRAACFVAMRKGGLQNQLGGITQPALVIWGAEDNVVPLRDASMVAQEWPRADLRILPGASHWPQFERPDAVIAHVSRFLGLPQLAGVHDNVQINEDPETVQLYADFLADTEIAQGLNETQRLRLAGQLQRRVYQAQQLIAPMEMPGDEMFIVRHGSLTVWTRPDSGGVAANTSVQIASLTAGKTAGELALIDGRPRSAELRAGPEGAVVLVLKESRFNALCVDDPDAGLRIMHNIAVGIADRLRAVNFRAARNTLAEQRSAAGRAA